MKIRFFLGLIYTALILLSLSIPLSAGGGRDKVLEDTVPLENQQDESQESEPLQEGKDIQEESQELRPDPVDEISQEGTEELAPDKEEEGLQEESQEEESGDVVLSNEPPLPQLLKDGKGNPRLHLYNGEETSILSNTTSKTLVTKADGNFSQILYDDEYRLKTRLTWKEGDTSPKEGENYLIPSEITSQEDYFYYENSRSRQRVVLTNFKEVSRKESFYSQDGILLKEELYIHVPEQEKKTSDSQKKNSQSQEKKLIKEAANTTEPKDLTRNPWVDFPNLSLVEVTEYQYNQDKALTEKKVTQHNGEERFVEKTLYQSPGDIHGGFDYFENDELMISRKYLDENKYTETRYFDNMRVETLYNGSRLISEVVYLDGNEIRRTEF